MLAGSVMFELIATFICMAVGSACLLWLPRSRRWLGNEPRCAACEYIVYGLPGPICPECGSDLSEPGAIIPGERRPARRIVRLIRWSVFCALTISIPSSILWSVVVMPRMPQVRDGMNQVMLSQPASGGYRSIAVDAHMHGNFYPNDPDPLPDGLVVTFTASTGKPDMLVIDPATLHFRDGTSSPSANSTAPLDANALVAWLSRMGVRATPDKLDREMAIVMTQVQQDLRRPPIHHIQRGGGFAGAGSAGGSSRSQLPWVSTIPALLAFTVWTIGIVRILMKPR
jgi:hypothetical protein